MGTVFPFNLKRVLTLKEARELLPIVRRVTDESQSKVESLLRQMELLPDNDAERKKALEKEINVFVDQWQSKIEKLGGEPKGLWLVDFDCGVGYFCWKFPEHDLDFFHGYTEGFKSRIRVSEKFDETHAETPSLPRQPEAKPEPKPIL